MIRISVDTEEELKIVRDCYIRLTLCRLVDSDECNSMNNCTECARACAHRYLEVFMRKVIEEPEDIVL